MNIEQHMLKYGTEKEFCRIICELLKVLFRHVFNMTKIRTEEQNGWTQETRAKQVVASTEVIENRNSVLKGDFS